MNTFERVRKVLVRELDITEQEVTLEANIMEDLSADSLDVIQIVMELEEEFGIEISEDEAKTIYTVQQILDYVDEKTKH